MIIVGVDPGVTGGLALLWHGDLTVVEPMPVHDGRVDGLGVSELLVDWQPDIVYLEATQPMPKNGSIASFSLGYNTGVVAGVVQSLGLPLHRVRPAEWKRNQGLIGKDKTASRGLARELFPRLAHCFKLVKQDGLAEAALIARYGAFQEIRLQNTEVAVR